ncbi:LOW QUALITY PROTEIN: histone H3-like centromeric protein A [Morphnus guianensis]
MPCSSLIQVDNLPPSPSQHPRIPPPPPAPGPKDLSWKLHTHPSLSQDPVDPCLPPILDHIDPLDCLDPSPLTLSPCPPPSPPVPPWRRPGQRALQQIRKYPSSTRLLLRPGPFARLVWEISLLFTQGVGSWWQRMALVALQDVGVRGGGWSHGCWGDIGRGPMVLEDAHLCSLHAHRVTLNPEDLQLARCRQGLEVGVV